MKLDMLINDTSLPQSGSVGHINSGPPKDQDNSQSLNLGEMCPEYDENANYKEAYWRLYFANNNMLEKLQNLCQQ